MARRNLCSIIQAALYFFSPSTRCSPSALAPFFWVVTHHIARNHTGKGMRVSWKIVPAVTEVWHPHPPHSHKLRTGHAFSDPQRDNENRSATEVAPGTPDTPLRWRSSPPTPSDYADTLPPPPHTRCGAYLSQGDTHLDRNGGPLQRHEYLLLCEFFCKLRAPEQPQ